MTTFRFALSGLLRLRSHELVERRRELSDATEAARVAQSESETGDALAREVERREARALDGGVRAADALALREESLARRGEATQAAERVETSLARIDASREQVQEAWRRMRALEELRRRAQERHRAELARREQRDLDEAARPRRRTPPCDR